MANISLPSPRYIYVQASEQLSPHVQRIYFSSDDFSDFPLNQNGAHIKLFFPEQAELKPLLPTRNAQGKVIWAEGKKPVTRTYTIRDFLLEEQLLVVDFVRHTDFGIAADWAIHAQKGHTLGLAGPGGRERFNPQADYWVFIGDLSSLPMIAASLSQLPNHAKGDIWIEIDDAKDQIPLSHPTAMTVHWLIKNTDVEQSIKDSLAQLNWDTQRISVTLAGENSRVISLGQLFRQQYQVKKSHLYAVPYWKQGATEEDYHQERHTVMDE